MTPASASQYQSVPLNFKTRIQLPLIYRRWFKTQVQWHSCQSHCLAAPVTHAQFWPPVLSVQRLHALPATACVFPGFSGFFPQAKDMWGEGRISLCKLSLVCKWVMESRGSWWECSENKIGLMQVYRKLALDDQHVGPKGLFPWCSLSSSFSLTKISVFGARCFVDAARVANEIGGSSNCNLKFPLKFKSLLVCLVRKVYHKTTEFLNG